MSISRKKTEDILSSKCWPVCITTSLILPDLRIILLTAAALMKCGLAPMMVIGFFNFISCLIIQIILLSGSFLNILQFLLFSQPDFLKCIAQITLLYVFPTYLFRHSRKLVRIGFY